LPLVITVSALTVLYVVFGFGLIFGGFAVLDTFSLVLRFLIHSNAPLFKGKFLIGSQTVSRQNNQSQYGTFSNTTTT